MHKDDFKKNAIWNAVGNIIYLAAQWIITVLVVRFYGYEDAGVLSLAMSISAIFQTLALFGMRNYQISDLEDKFSNSVYVSSRFVTCIAAVLICLVFSLFNNYEADTIISIMLFMVYRIADNYADVLTGIAQKYDRLDITGKSFALRGIVTLVAFMIGYYFFDSMNIGLGFMAILSCLITATYVYIETKKIVEFRLFSELSMAVKLLICTLPLCVQNFLATSISSVPKYILEKMCDATVLGAYSTIFSPTLIITAAIMYVYTPFVPKFAEYIERRDLKKFYSMTAKICVAIAAIGVLVIIAAAFLGEFALALVFGSSIVEYSYLLIPALISTAFTSLMGFFSMLEVVLRDFKGLIISNLIGLLLIVVCTPIMINSCGVNGTSYSLILSAGVVCAIQIIQIYFKGRTYGKNNEV